MGVIRSIHTIEQGSFRGTVILQNTMHGTISVSSNSLHYRKAALIVQIQKLPENTFFMEINIEVISTLRNNPSPRAPNIPPKQNVRFGILKNISRLDHSVAGYESQTRIQDHA